MKAEYPVIPFPSQEDWSAWLEINHAVADGIWLKFYKKASGVKTVVYKEALDEALCFGWIDGQVKSFDENAYIQKFTPRRPRSKWSKRNVEHVARLTSEGKMKPSGLAAVDSAKADGRWDLAYDSQSKMTVPDDFYKLLKKDKKAFIFFESLDKANKYSIGYRLQTAINPETRAKRVKAIIEMLQRGEKFHN